MAALTRKLHGALSGGEKAIALHLPLFAAVAAHYQAVPEAPRIILLDEVFAGVDSNNRGQVFGEAKVVTGVDDHSRFCVIATVVRTATGRAVCLAFVEALQRFGIPDEVLSDNGKQFTGRFNQPRPAEVMFERICRENGIVARHSKPRSPTTTEGGAVPPDPGAGTARPREGVAGRGGGAGRGGRLPDRVQHQSAAPVAGDGLPG